MLATLAGDPPRVNESKQVDGGPGIPVCQPQFSPDGRWLSYIVASGEWEDLMRIDLHSGASRILVHGDGFHLCDSAWVQGLRWHGWTFDGRYIYYLRNAGGLASLWVVDVESGRSTQIDTTPYTWLSGLSVSPAADEVAFWASAPSIPAASYAVNQMLWRAHPL